MCLEGFHSSISFCGIVAPIVPPFVKSSEPKKGIASWKCFLSKSRVVVPPSCVPPRSDRKPYLPPASIASDQKRSKQLCNIATQTNKDNKTELRIFFEELRSNIPLKLYKNAFVHNTSKVESELSL